MSDYGTPLAELLAESSLPSDFLAAEEGPLGALLDRVYFTDYAVASTDSSLAVSIELLFDGELALRLPGVDGFAFVLGGDGAGSTLVEASLHLDEQGLSVRLDGIALALRFPPTLLKPVPATPEATPPPFAQIATYGSIALDPDFSLRIEGFDALNLPPAMIGNTGVIVSASGVKLDFSRTETLPEIAAAGFDENFLGVYIGEAQVQLPPGLPPLVPSDLVLRQCAIGSGGISGRLEANYAPLFDTAAQAYTGQGAGQFFSIPFGLHTIALEWRENTFVESLIAGELLLPFFDKRLAVAIGLTLDGDFTVRVTGAAEPGDDFDNTTGLLTLERPGLLRLTVESIGLLVADGHCTTVLNGEITPLFGDLVWPSFVVRELRIDPDGRVHLDGGWLDLPEQYGLDFYGFQLEITKLGFGKTDDGGKWLGCAGGLRLVEGMAAGAAVDGLRLTWYEDGRPTRLTCDGVAVEFAVADVLQFKGAVSFRELPIDTPDGPAVLRRFDGQIALDLLALDVQIDGTLVIGTMPGAQGPETFFAIHLGLDLPAGLPLWATGLSLYGLAGLLAINMAPNRGAAPNELHPTSSVAETWYENPDGSAGWYKRAPVGVTDLASKWDPVSDSRALGAGVTIGTTADNGFAFSGRFLLVLVFPGPLLLIEGRANLLKERAKLDSEPTFRALAILDKRANTFLVGLDAQYRFGANGELIDMHGGAEAYFDLANGEAWHIHLGRQEPRDQRLQAKFASLFEANAYLQLDARQLAVGAWYGYDKSWQFGPLTVELESWIEGNAVLSWHPAHLTGDLWKHGQVSLGAYGFSVGLLLDARLEAEVFDPFHLLGTLNIALDLPWPLPDLAVDISLEWGPTPTPPALPLPLQEVAVEHFKVTTSWPLPRGGAQPLLAPNYRGADGSIIAPIPSVATQAAQPPPAQAPIVPLDARPHLTFSHAMHDDALIGVNAQPLIPALERLGDPARDEGPVTVRYALQAVALERHTGVGWVAVARKGITPNAAGVPTLFGSWAPLPQLPAGTGGNLGQTKLWLWSKTPFDAGRFTNGGWDDWFGDRFPQYPRIDKPQATRYCYDFVWKQGNQTLRSPLPHRDRPELVIGWNHRGPATIAALPGVIADRSQALRIPPPLSRDAGQPFAVVIRLPEAADQVELTIVAANRVLVRGETQQGTLTEMVAIAPSKPTITIQGPRLIRLHLEAKPPLFVVAICYSVGPTKEEQHEHAVTAQHLQDELARWSQPAPLLAPDTDYRLAIVTNLLANGEGALAGYARDLTQTEFAYFRTAGPPGLTTLSVPTGFANPAEFTSGLADLARYVRQTIPPTIPVTGQPPRDPRPVYRAYDIGILFNEAYVEQLYRPLQRDLGLQLLAANQAAPNGQPLARQWDGDAGGQRDASERRWFRQLDTSGAGALDPATIPPNRALAGRLSGSILAPDTPYEARLVPLLLLEEFTMYPLGATLTGANGALGRWQLQNQGTLSLASQWTIVHSGTLTTRGVVQTAANGAGSAERRAATKPGALLLWGPISALPTSDPAQPSQWTAIRATVTVRAAAGAIGLVFRYQDTQHHYRYAVDPGRSYRRLIRVDNGVLRVLAEDATIVPTQRDMAITVVAIGAAISIYQDGALVFAVTDDRLTQGTCGLYSWNSPGGTFRSVAVEDARAEAPVVHRHSFTTSRFAHFAHHLHSYQDEVWPLDLPSSDALDVALAHAVPLTTPPTAAEAQAFAAFTSLVLGPLANALPSAVEIARLQVAGHMRGFLLRCPEPLDWSRIDLTLSRTTGALPAPRPPREVKLTDVTFATATSTESVTLLVREETNLRGQRIEYRALPGPVALPPGDPILYEETFSGVLSGKHLREDFGPHTLDRYTIVDLGNLGGPSAWAVTNGQMAQTSAIACAIPATPTTPPGTLVLIGAATWDNLRIEVGLHSPNGQGIGVAFRYRDAANHYRFVTNQSGQFQALVSVAENQPTLLWSEPIVAATNQPQLLTIETVGDCLTGYLDERLLFSLRDTSHPAGLVGLGCWQNAGARFTALSVESLDTPPLLNLPTLPDLRAVTVCDEPGSGHNAGSWSLGDDGSLIQTTLVGGTDVAAQSGTLALIGDPIWRDIRSSARLEATPSGAVAFLFRVSPEEIDAYGQPLRYRYYRWSFQDGQSSLSKRVNGALTTLWQGTVPASATIGGQATIKAVGRHLRGFLNGQLLFSVQDGEIPAGQVGFACWQNATARFSGLLVTTLTRQIGSWTIIDDDPTTQPSSWQRAAGRLTQGSTVQTTQAPPFPGTLIVTGSANWADLRIVAQIQRGATGTSGIIVRYRDPDNYYWLALDNVPAQQRLVRRSGGVITTLWSGVVPYPADGPVVVTIDAVGPRLVAYLGTTRLFALDDVTHDAGRIGLSNTGGGPGQSFRSIVVRRPPLLAYALFADEFTGTSLQGWQVSDEGTLGGPSQWSVAGNRLRQTSAIRDAATDPLAVAQLGTQIVAGDVAWGDVIVQARCLIGANGASGVVFRYQDNGNHYRFTFDHGLGARLVRRVGGLHSLLWEGAAVPQAGQFCEIAIVAQGAILRGYLNGVLAFQVVDGAISQGRAGLYCRNNTAAQCEWFRVYPATLPQQGVLLSERFATLLPDRWVAHDEGQLGGPSHWHVGEDGLRQEAAIHDSDPDDATRQRGTALVAGKAIWSDYRAQARASATQATGALGLVARYQGPDDYYRLLIDFGSARRSLVRRRHGVTTILWQDNGASVPDREYAITLDCIGTQLRGYSDGVQLFSIADDGLSSGQIGCYCWASGSVRFSEVEVCAPIWHTYHRFSEDERPPEGTRLQLFTGSVPAGLPPRAGQLQRSKQGVGESSDPSFDAAGVSLRLVGDTPVAGHLRTFSPPEDYQAIAAQVLRKADGTGVIIFPTPANDAGSTLPEHYRLTASYRRDNRANDPASLLFSQNGDQGNEQVIIDLPWAPWSGDES